MFADGHLVEFLNWSPDSRHFLYWFFEDATPLLGDRCGAARSQLEGLKASIPVWLNAISFIYPAETDEGQGLFLGTVEGAPQLLGRMEGPAIYDLVKLPAP